MRTLILWGSVCCLSIGIGFSPFNNAGADDALGVYENWKGKFISPEKWLKGKSDDAFEIVREIDHNNLIMRTRTFSSILPLGPYDSSTAFLASSANRLFFLNPSSIDAMEVDFRVKSAYVEVCPSPVINASAQEVHGRIRPAVIDIVKYNGAENPPTGISMTGDWIMRLQVNLEDNAERADELVGQAFLLKCADAACANASTPPITDPNSPYKYFDVNLGTVKIGEKFTLRIIWDQAGKAFIVGLNSYNTTFMYDPGDNKRPSLSPFASIRTQLYPVNCHDQRNEADAIVEVLEVRTNVSAIVN